jgi:hypothetical protein
MMETSGQALGRGLETRAQRDRRLASKYSATSKLAYRVGVVCESILSDECRIRPAISAEWPRR